MDRDQMAAKFNEALAESVAIKVAAGLELAEVKGKIGEAFPKWVASICGTPLAEAELLMRWAADRPSWVDPAAVDVKDPLVWELFEIGLARRLREMGVPIEEVD